MASSDHLTSLLKTLEQLSDFRFENDGERRVAMAAAQNATAKLESPFDKVLNTWAQAAKDAAIQIGIDLGLFTKWKASGGPRSALELATMTGCDPALMSSLLKHLASTYVINEVGPSHYSPTAYSTALARPEIAACITLHFDTDLPAFWKLPSFVAKNGYARPNKLDDTPLNDAVGFQGKFFDYLLADARRLETFGKGMKGYAADRPAWIDIYPVEQQLLQGLQDDTPLLVDVGGGMGYDILKFRGRFLQEPRGRLILQEQEQVIADVKREGVLPEDIECQVHDFFKEQPIQGARVYYLHSILHDWQDEAARNILTALKPALQRGYSKILLNENVLAAQNANKQITTFDMIMMVLFGSRERSEDDFRTLVESAGLEVTKIWTHPIAVESIIQCELP